MRIARRSYRSPDLPSWHGTCILDGCWKDCYDDAVHQEYGKCPLHTGGEAELVKLGLHGSHVELGEAVIEKALTPRELRLLSNRLEHWGFELLSDAKAILVERIKNLVIGSVHYGESSPNVKFSAYLSEALHHDYTYLANVFSAGTASSIRDYITNQKIERAKEMIAYDEGSFAEIAFVLHYCNVAHFSNQFKHVTGYTPSECRSLEHKPLRELEKV